MPLNGSTHKLNFDEQACRGWVSTGFVWSKNQEVFFCEQGRRSHVKSEGAQGGYFFSCNFLLLFGRFGKMIYLVNLKKWGGSSRAPSAPPCTPLLSVRVDKLNFRESPVKISNVVGTPNSLSMSFIWAQCNLLSYYVECRHIMQRNSVPNLVYVFLKKKTVFNNFGSFLSTTTSFQLFVCFTKIPHLNI